MCCELPARFVRQAKSLRAKGNHKKVSRTLKATTGWYMLVGEGRMWAMRFLSFTRQMGVVKWTTVGILVPRAGRGDWLIWHALRRLTGSPQHVPQSIRSAGLRKREMRRASDLPRAGEVLLACDDTRESRAFPRLTLPDGWCASPEDETWKLSTRA